MTQAERQPAGDSQGPPPGAPAPRISVVIAVWNRADTIRRCLDSVLEQSFGDLEILAVDDGSSDDSVAVMRTYDDPRLHVMCREENGGPCAAWQTGIDVARAEWVLILGSDDALLPGVLDRIWEMAQAASADVGVVGTALRYDGGRIGPQPPYPEKDVDFPTFLGLRERGTGDFLRCYRREVFDGLPYPTDGRGATQFATRFASRWKLRVDPTPGEIVYTDAKNQLTRHKAALLPKKRLLAHAIEVEDILREFGPALRKHAPNWHTHLRFALARWRFLCGHRWRGARAMLGYLLRRPASLYAWVYLLGGLIGPRTLMRLRSLGKTKGK